MGLALIDQDGVVADFERGLLDELSERDGRAPRIEIADRRIFSAREQYEQEFPPWHDEVDAIMHTEGFYAGLPECSGPCSSTAAGTAAGTAALAPPCGGPAAGNAGTGW